MRVIFHIDFNSFFATVEQQANPRLRGKPIGVTGGDRMNRTVIGAASVEAKKYGVKTGMQIWEAKKLCPNIILVKGDCDKYLECTKKFINILRDYSSYLEVFSIDEVFLEIPPSVIPTKACLAGGQAGIQSMSRDFWIPDQVGDDSIMKLFQIAQSIKHRIRAEIGDWITCSIGISYNKLVAKLAGSLYKPDGLVGIFDASSAMMLLDQVELDEVCGIGHRIKSRLNNMGVFNFRDLRKVPLSNLIASFKVHQGQILYNMARGIDNSMVIPFYEKEEVKSVGHRHTLDHDTDSPLEIKQVLLKLTELIGRRLRAKKLVGRTVVCYYRSAFQLGVVKLNQESLFSGDGMQTTIPYTNDGLEIFQAAWKIFMKIWNREKIRMIGVSGSNLRPENPESLSLLEDVNRTKKITKVLDRINDRFGEFTLQRGVLLNTPKVYRKPNPFLADRRFRT